MCRESDQNNFKRQDGSNDFYLLVKVLWNNKVGWTLLSFDQKSL